MSNCAIITLEGELALGNLPPHRHKHLHLHPHTHMLAHLPPHGQMHMLMQKHMHTLTHLPLHMQTHPHPHTPVQQHRTCTRHKWFHVPPANCQCHLTLGPHMSCLCVHDVSHPCTHTHCIVQWPPAMSPAYFELIYGYTSFGLGVCVTHTHLHPRYCVVGSTIIIRKMTIPQRQSPFMDDLVN
ncbi:hypothetical protein O181_009483 [Austropuccinia psidii MF-1]|uniref:Uncharacterized protein n=1 Tax=Austropuccinia psidii MF-1 TaxID=1389203 RepID=A0A9Q3BRF9_9BASI|nr:hypothetical protein [Austropuccinia psidii MF-1]